MNNNCWWLTRIDLNRLNLLLPQLQNEGINKQIDGTSRACMVLYYRYGNVPWWQSNICEEHEKICEPTSRCQIIQHMSHAIAHYVFSWKWFSRRSTTDFQVSSNQSFCFCLCLYKCCVMMILCHLIQKQPPKPPKNFSTAQVVKPKKKLCNSKHSHSELQRKSYCHSKLALGIVAELKRTVWGWRDEYERSVMWWIFYGWGGHKTSHEDPTSQFSFQTISLKKIPSSCFVSWDFWWVGFFFFFFNLERYLTESWQILKNPP